MDSGMTKRKPASTFREFHRQMRFKNKMTMRKFCLKDATRPSVDGCFTDSDYEYDISFVSKVERERAHPPEDAILKRWAAKLNLKEGSEDYREYFELAEKARKTPIKPITRQEALKKLPVFWHTKDGNPPTEEMIESFIQHIINE